MKVIDLLEYENIDDKYESLFTILIYGKTKEEFLNNFKKYQKKCGTIKNAFKKNIVCNRLYKFISYVEITLTDDKINNIFLVGDDIIVYPLKKKEIATLCEYNIKDYLFYFDTYFKVEYLVNVLTNFDFTNSIVLSSGQLSFAKLNKYKKKYIFKKKCKNIKDLEDFIKETDIVSGVISGQNNIIKKYTKNGFAIYNTNLSDNEIFDKVKDNKMIVSHKELEDLFSTFRDESKFHLLLLGRLDKDIKEAIECYQVKMLYCHTEKLKELKSQCSKECYNFTIIEINKVCDNDISMKLLNDYGGVVGVKYY